MSIAIARLLKLLHYHHPNPAVNTAPLSVLILNDADHNGIMLE